MAQNSTPKPPTGLPDAAEFGRLRAYLAQIGLTQLQINQAISNNPSGRTRQQIADALRAWLAAR